MEKIDDEFYIPDSVRSQLNEYIEQCDFYKITQYLNELISQNTKKKS
jgi:hypothetical protein